jgi:hypothetical protein
MAGPIISPPDFAGDVRSWGEGIVDSYLSTRTKNDSFRSIKASIEEATGEYGGRFFFELLQNAHDAHDAAEGDGRVLIVLDETAVQDGSHGCIYVADAGRGFNYENFRAISNLSLSSKPVGEGIGNKGVGFKSVLQICAAPEIYSRNPDDRDEDGYRFRFADHDDIRSMVNSEEEFDWVLSDVSRYTVPVPIVEVPADVRALRDLGYSTVFKLPLNGEQAAIEASVRFGELVTLDAPVGLFLNRIRQLLLHRRTAGGTEVHEISRSAASLTTDGEIRAELVRIGDAQPFVVVTTEVDSERYKAGIRTAVDGGRLKRKWLEWQGVAEVSLALPYGWHGENHRLYTYLPMGADASSPIPGHLHAPFFADYSRTGIDADHPLNKLLLDACAELAVDASRLLLGGLKLPDAGKDLRPLSEVVVDLLSWRPERIEHLRRAAPRGASLPGLDHRPVPMLHARKWPHFEWDVLTVDLASRATETRFVLAELDEDRLERIEATCRALGSQIALTAEELAQHVELMAAACHKAGIKPSEWDLLYDDLAYMFEDSTAQELAGRRILLAEDGTLQRCAEPGDPAVAGSPAASSTGASPASGQTTSGPAAKGGQAARRRATRRRQATAYFQPARDHTEDEEEVDSDVELEIPAALKDHLFFVHPDLNWRTEDRQTTKARDLFFNNKLIRRYQARPLVESTRAMLRATKSRRAHQQGCRFLFNLRRSSPTATLPLANSELLLPTLGGGTVQAREALFSKGWTTGGEDLHTLSTTPAELSGELAALQHRLIAPPDDFLRRGETVDQWVEFLRRVGVTDRLPILRVKDRRTPYGGRLVRNHFTTTPGLPAPIAAQWTPHIPADVHAHYNSTPYKCVTDITWLPGQAEHDQLPQALKDAYERILIRSLGKWEPGVRTTKWHRDRSGDKNEREIRTPLAVFVQHGRWLSVRDPQSRHRTYAAPKDSWHFLGGTDTDPPKFAPLVAAKSRHLLDAHDAALQWLRSIGLGIWQEPMHGFRLANDLAHLLAADRVDAALLPQLSNAHRYAWDRALAATKSGQETGGSGATNQTSIRSVIVRVGKEQRAQAITGQPEDDSLPRIVVTDEGDDPFIRRVAEDFDLPVLHVSSRADAAFQKLVDSGATTAVRAADLGLNVYAQGKLLDTDVASEQLLGLWPWTAPLITVLLQHATQPHERPNEKNRRKYIETLNRVQIVRAQDLTVGVGAERRPIPTRMRGVVPMPHPTHPAIAITAVDDGDLTWDQVDAAATPLMQLLEFTRVTSELKLAISKLRAHTTPHQTFTSAEIAEACDLDDDIVRNTLADDRVAAHNIVDRLIPVVQHLWGGAAADRLAAGRDDLTHDALARLLSLLAIEAGQDSQSASDLLKQAEQAFDLDELRIAAKIPLANINATLRQMTPPREVIDYELVHLETFNYAVLNAWDGLTDRLRWAFKPEHDGHQAIDGWTDLRDRTQLTAPAGWNTELDAVEDEQAVNEAVEQLARRAGRPLPVHGPDLAPLTRIRAANLETSPAAVKDIIAIVAAWSTKQGAALPDVLTSATRARDVLDRLDNAGALDFEVLTRDEIVAWLASLQIWPEQMPQTATLSALGLEPSDLDAEATEDERQAQRKRAERQRITVDDKLIDVNSGYDDLLTTLADSLNNSPHFVETRQRFTSLADPPKSNRGQKRLGGRASNSNGRDRPSEIQTAAIGFAGEWLAYQWLTARYPQANEASWVSKNRAFVFPGNPGNDGLGYDFIIPLSRERMYEVKATTGDGGEIRLGESEVLAAQENSRRDWRLLIITNALDANRRILQLPNPFSPDARGRFTIAGTGLRFLFNLDDKTGSRE